MKFARILFLSLLMNFFLFSAVSADVPKKRIVATIGMIADVVSVLVNDNYEIVSLIGSGVDPHLYKPTRGDMAALSSASVVFYNGLFLEGKLIEAIKRVAKSGIKVVPVGELIDKNNLMNPAGFDGNPDPHIWMDPVLWGEVAQVIADELIKNFPVDKAIFQKNIIEYSTKINRLNRYINKITLDIPKESRIIVSAHDAFGYFGKRYGFEVLGIQGISTESEAGVRDIENLVDRIVKSKIRAVFIESTVSDRNIKALKEGAMARGHKVEIGGTLFSDAMGLSGSYTGTYIGMLDHNATTIVTSLAGKFPAIKFSEFENE